MFGIGANWAPQPDDDNDDDEAHDDSEAHVYVCIRCG